MYADAAQTHVVHAEVRLGDSVLMLFDRDPGWPPTPTYLNVYVPDCDEAHRRALAAGAVEVTALSTSAWGDRGSRICDPFGNLGWVQTRVEELTEAEVDARMAQPHYVEDLEVAGKALSREMLRRAVEGPASLPTTSRES